MAGMRKWRRHSEEFKRQTVVRMKTCENIEALARELDVQRKLLYVWKEQLEGRPEPRHANLALTAEERKEKQLRGEIARLKSTLADQILENDFFRSALQRVEAECQKTETGAAASTTSSGRGRKSKAR